MAEKLTDRPILTTAADADIIHIVDVSDVTDSAQGTSKQITKANLFSGMGGGTTDASLLTTGVLADGRVQQSNVTQHQSALSISSAQVTGFDEAAQDAVGAMVTGNTENGIVVTYDDGANKLNFDVNDPTITLSGDLTGSAVMTNLGNVTISAQVANDSHTHDSRYYTEAESDGRYSLLGHTHTTSDITNLSSYTGFDTKYLGINAKAADSNLLDGIDSTTFARKDVDNGFSAQQTAPSYKMGLWTFETSGTNLLFKYNNVTRFTLSELGDLTATKFLEV